MMLFGRQRIVWVSRPRVASVRTFFVVFFGQSGSQLASDSVGQSVSQSVSQSVGLARGESSNHAIRSGASCRHTHPVIQIAI